MAAIAVKGKSEIISRVQSETFCARLLNLISKKNGLPGR